MTRNTVNEMISRDLLMKLEGSVCDVVNTAAVVEGFIEPIITALGEGGTISEVEINAASYILVHLTDLTQALRNDFYASVKASR